MALSVPPNTPIAMLTVEQLDHRIRKAVTAALGARTEPSEVMTTDDAGTLLKLDPQTIAKYAQTGKLPAHRLGPEWRFYRSELLQWLREQGR